MKVCADHTTTALLSSPGVPIGIPVSMKRNPNEKNLSFQRLLSDLLMDVPGGASSEARGHEESKGNQESTHPPQAPFGISRQQEQLPGNRHLVSSLLQRQSGAEREYESLIGATRAPSLPAPASLAQHHQLELQQRLLAMGSGTQQRATSLSMPNSFLGGAGEPSSIQASMLQRIMAEEQQRNRLLAQAQQIQANTLLSNDLNLQLRARALLGSGLVGGNDSRNLIGPLSNSNLGYGLLTSSENDMLRQVRNLQGAALSRLQGLSNAAPSTTASSSRGPASLSTTSAPSSAASPIPPASNDSTVAMAEGERKLLARPRKRKAREAPVAANIATADGGRTSPSTNVAVHCVPHHRERPYSSLGIEEDENWLSSFQCFVRSELMEVVKASQFDVMVRSTSKSILPNQVGVRCRFCAHLPPGSRTSRSSAFPSSIDKLYQSFSMMVRDHFVHCSELPADLSEKFQTLKGKNAQGATDSKQYWVYAARYLGMQDAARGIEISDATKEAAKKMLPYGMTADTAKTIKASAEELPLLSNPEQDKATFTAFLYKLLDHLRIVHLLASEQVGKRKGLPVGLEGLGCKYCLKEGRLGFSRCFPLRRRALPAHVHDLYQHCLRCTLCPSEVKKQLSSIFNPEVDTMSKIEKEVESFSLIWDKLGRKRDLTTS